MQKFVTPHPGRSPAKPEPGNIVNRPDYKLDVSLTEFRTAQFVLTIDTFITEHGWISKQYFLTEDELDKVKAVLNDGTNKS